VHVLQIGKARRDGKQMTRRQDGGLVVARVTHVRNYGQKVREKGTCRQRKNGKKRGPKMRRSGKRGIPTASLKEI